MARDANPLIGLPDTLEQEAVLYAWRAGVRPYGIRRDDRLAGFGCHVAVDERFKSPTVASRALDERLATDPARSHLIRKSLGKDGYCFSFAIPDRSSLLARPEQKLYAGTYALEEHCERALAALLNLYLLNAPRGAPAPPTKEELRSAYIAPLLDAKRAGTAQFAAERERFLRLHERFPENRSYRQILDGLLVLIEERDTRAPDVLRQIEKGMDLLTD